MRKNFIAAFFIACITFCQVIFAQEQASTLNNDIKINCNTDDFQISLSEECITNDSLVYWAMPTVTEILTFGYHDYRRRLKDSSRHFTRRGWESFSDALVESSFLEDIIDNRVVVSTSGRGKAKIISQGKNSDGIYVWEIDVPIEKTLENFEKSRVDQNIVRLILTRDPEDNNIAIDQWIEYIP